MTTPLIFGDEQKRALASLRERAAASPVDLKARMSADRRGIHPEWKRRHMDQMNAQTVMIPMGFLVTFSIESGHPAGVCRHMSMSSAAQGRTPTEAAIKMIADELGFVGFPEFCMVYKEELQRGERTAIAVNVIQPLVGNWSEGALKQ